MLHPSTKRLIDKLNDMTRKQRVTWTEGENATVIHDTEGYRVVLTPEPHSMLLTDTLGREIETCGPEEFADETDALGRPYAKFVGELYREASRHARGTEKAIRALLAGLDAVEETAPDAALALAPVTQTLGVPDATTDETAPIESETEITAAVATLADQINGTQQAETLAATEATPPPSPEPEPAPVVLAQPEPEPVIAPEPLPVAPEPEPAVETVVAEAAPAIEPVSEAQVEAPAPSVEVPPLAEEPGSFGTFAEFTPAASESEPAPQPAPEPALEVQPEPEPEPVPLQAPVPQPEPQAIEAATPEPEAPPAPPPVLPAPTLAQPISLSSIPFGFGLGAAQRTGAPVHPSTSPPSAPEPASEPAKRILIDGTLDLPDFTPDSLEASPQDPYPPPTPSAGPKDLPGEPGPPPEPGHPRRFNPWN